MRALLLRLSALDADAEGAVRVITVFDGLVRQHLGATALVRATAQLAGCPAGVSGPQDEVVARRAPDGSRLVGARPDVANRVPVDGGGHVWLERPDGPHALDGIVLERLAAAVAISRGLQASTAPALGDPALVELVISHSADAPERSRALHLIGLTRTARIRVIASADELPGLVGQSPDLLGHAPVGDLHAAILVGDALVARLAAAPPPTRIGVGPVVRADEAWRSWRGARVAVRLADATSVPDGTRQLFGGPVVRWDDLGGFAAIAESVPRETALQTRDVRALDRLVRARGGPAMLATLHTVCMTDSLRHAATAMHLHHSSVAARLVRAEEALGFPVRTASGRIRLAVALTLHRLHGQMPAS